MSIQLEKEDSNYINQLVGEKHYSWLSLPSGPIDNDESQWGSQAKDGYSYRTNLNGIMCPSCLRRIDSRYIVHKMDSDGNWRNFCRFCRPELKPAL